MKKIISLLLSVVMVLSLVACGGGAKTPATPAGEGQAASGKIKIGMVTDVGGVHDQSFNQSSWEGLEKLAICYKH